MTEEKPTFFEGRRVSVFFKGGRLAKDAKTEQRFWRLKWAITVQPADAYACRGAIQSNYEHIQARENGSEKIELAGLLMGMTVTVYPHSQDDAPQVLLLADCMLDKFAMTYADGMTEFWLFVEHPLTDQLHAFVRDYAFQRFWVEFERQQRSLAEVTDAAQEFADKMQEFADRDAITTSIHTGGKKIAEFKPKGRVN